MMPCFFGSLTSMPTRISLFFGSRVAARKRESLGQSPLQYLDKVLRLLSKDSKTTAKQQKNYSFWSQVLLSGTLKHENIMICQVFLGSFLSFGSSSSSFHCKFPSKHEATLEVEETDPLSPLSHGWIERSMEVMDRKSEGAERSHSELDTLTSVWTIARPARERKYVCITCIYICIHMYM